MWWVDILILIIISYNVINGLRRGFIRSVIELFGLYISTVFGMRYGGQMVVSIYESTGIILPYHQVTGFLIVWLIVFLSTKGLGVLLNRVFSMSILGPINVFGGAVFGMGRGLVFVLPVVLPILFFNPSSMEHSFFVQAFKPQLVSLATKIFSEDNIDKISNHLDQSTANSSQSFKEVKKLKQTNATSNKTKKIPKSESLMDKLFQ